MTAVKRYLCPEAPRTLRPCPYDGGGPIELGSAFKDVRLHLVSLGQMYGEGWDSGSGAAFISFKRRGMYFAPDDSYAGGRWKWAQRSTWEQEYRCIAFTLYGSTVTDVGRFGYGDEEELPILRLYGNKRGECPVRTTPRKGMKPGWTQPPPVSTCTFFARNDTADGPISEQELFLSFKLEGVGGAPLCDYVTRAVFAARYHNATVSSSPLPGQEGANMPVRCRFSITSQYLSERIERTLAPARYTVEFRAGEAWLQGRGLRPLDLGTGACQ